MWEAAWLALLVATLWSVWQLGRRAGERDGRAMERRVATQQHSERVRKGWETRRASVAMRRATGVVVPALASANADMSAAEVGSNVAPDNDLGTP